MAIPLASRRQELTRTPHRAAAGSALPAPHPWALRSYSFIGDGERGALIDPDGAWVWLCAPWWDSEPAFDALLGGAGHFQVMPTEPHSWGGCYEEGSLVWRNRWVTQGAIVECADALAMPPAGSAAVGLRRIEAVDGTAPVAMRLRLPAPGPAGWTFADGAWTGRSARLFLRLTVAGDMRFDVSGSTLTGTAVVSPRGNIDVVLELAPERLRQAPPDPGRSWERTRRNWRRDLPALEGVIAGRDARHAYAILRGLTSRGGGIVAAATMALPERAESGRDYDYRYAWVRDQAFAGLAGAAAPGLGLLDTSVGFIQERLLADGPRLRPLYRADGGEAPATPVRVPLPGYPGAASVTAGNGAAAQFQLDCFGEALLLFAEAARLDRLGPLGWRAAEVAALAIQSRWTEPESGMWELDDTRMWTSSRLVCAAGLRAMAAVARRAPHAARWGALADKLLDECLRTSVHPTGRWQAAPDDPSCDASLLIGEIRGAAPPRDQRATATRRAVVAELSEDGYVFRNRARHGQPEGAFLLCSFWLALAEHRAGNAVAAARWFERARAACGPAGVFAEEYDVRQRQLRGNLPQAFVHAVMLETAAVLGAAPAA